MICISRVVFYMLRDTKEPKQTPVCLLNSIHEILIMMIELRLVLI